jgi:integrase/recombinase XerD
MTQPLDEGLHVESSIKRFLAHMLEKRAASENTLLAYSTDLEQFQNVLEVNRFGGVEVGFIKAEWIQAYIDWLDLQGYRPATISRKVASCRSFLDYMEAEEGVSTQHLTRLLTTPPAERHEPLTLRAGEVQTLLDAPRRRSSAGALRDAAILAILYETGFRAAELVGLSITDLDLQGRRVWRPPDRSDWRPIPDSERTVRRYLVEARPHLLRQPGELTLFLNQRGNALSRQGLWLVVKRWASEVGLDPSFSPHTLRHTRARDLLNQGHSRREVQEFLALSSPNGVRVRRSRNLEQQEA